MRRFAMVMIVVFLTGTVAQAQCYPWAHVLLHPQPSYYRAPIHSYYGYGYRTQRMAVVGSIGLGVLDRVIQAKQEDRAMEIAERQQEQRLQQQQQRDAVRQEAERQQMFRQATELKARQTEKENEQLRLENERLRLELENRELKRELQSKQ